jgi:hypothetical protein
MVELKLATSEGEKILHFKTYNTPVAQRWQQSLRWACEGSRIREDQRIYNFPQGSLSDKEIISQIESCLAEIQKKAPDQIPALKVDIHDPQNSVNQIHIHFVDSDRYNARGLAPQAWNDLNNWLHAYESHLRSAKTSQESGLPEANLVVTWHDPFIQDLQDEDYKHFTIKKKFGTCYINYCQVGRHLLEMFLADDDVAKDEHISPLRKLSADSYFWFGTTTGPRSYEKKMFAIQAWFQKHEQRLNSLGFFWSDPRIALGWIPVAELIDLPELEDQMLYLNRLGEIKKVTSLKSLSAL